MKLRQSQHIFQTRAERHAWQEKRNYINLLVDKYRYHLQHFLTQILTTLRYTRIIKLYHVIHMHVHNNGSFVIYFRVNVGYISGVAKFSEHLTSTLQFSEIRKPQTDVSLDNTGVEMHAENSFF
jgi:hypothetical protein